MTPVSITRSIAPCSVNLIEADGLGGAKGVR